MSTPKHSTSVTVTTFTGIKAGDVIVVDGESKIVTAVAGGLVFYTYVHPAVAWAIRVTATARFEVWFWWRSFRGWLSRRRL